MSEYREINLGREANEYVKERLNNGNSLARLLLTNIDLDGGKVVTYFPPEITDDEALDFTNGKLSAPPSEGYEILAADGSHCRLVPVPDTNLMLKEIISQFLRDDGRRVCLFEDPLVQSGDPWLLSPETRILIFEDEVYHFLSRHDLDGDQIIKTIRRATTAWQFVGLMTHVLKNDNFAAEDGRITHDQLRKFSDRADIIVVGAYDGEGYLIWSKD